MDAAEEQQKKLFRKGKATEKLSMRSTKLALCLLNRKKIKNKRKQKNTLEWLA